MARKQAIHHLLKSEFTSDCLLVDEPMSAHTTFKVGGPADFYVRPRNAAGVKAAVEAAREADYPYYLLGCGSNVLVSDKGLRALVIEIGPNMSDIRVEGTQIRAQAGATNEAVAQAALDAGLAGYEFASGIPGSIGGAAIMDAGAYDGEFKDVGLSVSCLTPDGRVVEVPAAEADWSYRHSMMMDRGYIVLAASIGLKHGEREAIKAKMDDLAERRAAKQPLEMASAGSTFKRPEGYFAGKLIQEAGMRGHSVGAAQVSEKHCGFVINRGGASAAEVLQVIRDVQAAVLASSGVKLECEVRLWGFE